MHLPDKAELEQDEKEIQKISDELDDRKGREWYKLKGEIVNRTIAKYLEKYLNQDYKVVGPHVFIIYEDQPIEYDILILDKDAKPVEDDCVYGKDYVKLILEIKKTGLYYKEKEFESEFIGYLDKLSKPVGRKYLVYITLRESTGNKKRIDNFLENTGAAYKDNVFIMGQTGGKREWNPGIWEAFIGRILELLKASPQ
ncbi:MAG: hypothetical protein QXV17_13255 [Candidatus Micrarchaeaceae archaeon]